MTNDFNRTQTKKKMSACESGLMEYIRYLSINIEFLSTDGVLGWNFF